jgi:hypothetical protein
MEAFLAEHLQSGIINSPKRLASIFSTTLRSVLAEGSIVKKRYSVIGHSMTVSKETD